MKNIVVSVSLAALGTAGLHAATSASGDNPRPWGVSGTFDGFYDDNINSAADNAKLGSAHRGSTGFEVAPAISLNWPWEEGSSLSANYVYTFKYYDNKPQNTSDNYDQTHAFNLALNHSFSESYAVGLKDSLVIGQEPDFLRAGNTWATYARVSGNNIRNVGSFTLDGRLSPLLSFEFGYQNTLYRYADDAIGGTAGLLDRMEQAVHLDSRWQLLPDTTGILGYQFSDAAYTAGQPISPGYMSDARNSRSHYGYVGLDHQFQPALSGAIRVGARLTDYYNDPTESDAISPYLQLSLHYGYAPESYVEGGVTLDRSATDLIGTGPSGITVDSETTSIYATLYHRLAPKLYGSIILQFQNSDYNGGIYNNSSEQYYTAGLNVEYKFSANLSGHIGYNYDRLESGEPLNRGFDRNRVYLGITASY